MRKVSIGLLFLFISLGVHSQNDTLRALFLGNSYTGANNLPLIVQNLSAGANKTLIVDTHSPGGQTLFDHSINNVSLNKIQQGIWDFVILQEQSQIPTIDTFKYSFMYPAATNLNDSIKKYNPCARVMLYMTWGRRFGGQQCGSNGANCSPVFVDFSHMQDSLESAYVDLANRLGASVSPAGVAWKKVIEDTTIVLHTTDNSHPNYNGSYLTACVFYSAIWNESPIGLTFSGSLPSPLATYFQAVADSVVFHTSSSWNLDINDVRADYSHTAYGDSVQFTNLSQALSPSSYFWDFGDGSTSNKEHPYHIYTPNQTYNVSLIAEHCAKRDTLTQTINIHPVGIESIHLESIIQAFPNPTSSSLEIVIDKKGLDLNLQIVNTIGRVFEKHDIKNKQRMKFNLAYFPKGVYFIKVLDKKTNKQAIFKVLKK